MKSVEEGVNVQENMDKEIGEMRGECSEVSQSSVGMSGNKRRGVAKNLLRGKV